MKFATTYERRHRSRQGFTLIEILVVVGVIALLASVGMVVVNKSRTTASRQICIGNLMQMNAAKQRWALDENKGPGDIPMDSELYGEELYLEEKPECPSGGSYEIKNVNEEPVCSLGPAENHALSE